MTGRTPQTCASLQLNAPTAICTAEGYKSTEQGDAVMCTQLLNNLKLKTLCSEHGYNRDAPCCGVQHALHDSILERITPACTQRLATGRKTDA